MATKLKLTFGNPPSSFKKEVVVSILNEQGEMTDSTFEVTYVYRTRTQFGELMDEYITKQQSPIDVNQDVDVTVKSIMDYKNLADVDAIMKIAKDWTLDVPFNKESLTEMSDRYPAVISAITEAYRQAIMEGRIKN